MCPWSDSHSAILLGFKSYRLDSIPLFTVVAVMVLVSPCKHEYYGCSISFHQLKIIPTFEVLPEVITDVIRGLSPLLEHVNLSLTPPVMTPLSLGLAPVLGAVK